MGGNSLQQVKVILLTPRRGFARKRFLSKTFVSNLMADHVKLCLFFILMGCRVGLSF